MIVQTKVVKIVVVVRKTELKIPSINPSLSVPGSQLKNLQAVSNPFLNAKCLMRPRSASLWRT